MKKRVEIRLSTMELEKIKSNARICNMCHYAFSRKSAEQMLIITFKHRIINIHESQINFYNKIIWPLFFFVKRTEKYAPLDLLEILKIKDELFKYEGIFLNLYMKYYFFHNKKIMKKTLVKYINKD